MSLRLTLLLLAVTSYPVNAQYPLRPALADEVNHVFNGSEKADPLNCEIKPINPFLDFSFRFEVGYIVECPISQFGGKTSNLFSYLRVTPAGRAPVILADALKVPEIPPEMRDRVNLRRVQYELEFSGVFAVGAGEYPVDLLIVDDHKRVARKSWRAKAKFHGKEEKISPALPANSAASIVLPPWTGRKEGAANKLRLTVLLDAAPLNPSSQKLRAWDRAFLLGALSSLMREVSCASVKLVAFNLDQQREVFRQEHFDHRGFRELAQSLQTLELGTVSYRTLARQSGGTQLLTNLLAGELSVEPASDAIVFLGANLHIRENSFRDSPALRTLANRRVFYLEYFPVPGSEFPDSIQYLTSASSGTVLRLHSPGDLADSIRKMQKHLEQDGIVATCPSTRHEP